MHGAIAHGVRGELQPALHRGTGEAKCAGFKSFQGAIWENDDTFEFMAQFENENNRVRLARIGREYLPEDRRLCDLVTYLREDSWK